MEENKFCCDCKYIHTCFGEEPCKSCKQKSNWVAMEEKTCGNCKYASASCHEKPCVDCYSKSNWVYAWKSYKFKTGDIVTSKLDTNGIKNIYIYLYNGWVLRVPNYVVVRSECNYRFSTYMLKLIDDNIAVSYDICNLEYPVAEVITEHDNRAKTFYITETLNEWFSILIKDKPYKAWTVKDPGLGYKDYGTRYDKYPTLNANFIKRVIFSDPATIVFWEDGTKTVVKTQDGEKYDKEKGFAMAVCKKVFGNERDYYNIFKRWMRKGKEVANEQR